MNRKNVQKCLMNKETDKKVLKVKCEMDTKGRGLCVWEKIDKKCWSKWMKESSWMGSMGGCRSYFILLIYWIKKFYFHYSIWKWMKMSKNSKADYTVKLS